jgi:hypothetical protein
MAQHPEVGSRKHSSGGWWDRLLDRHVPLQDAEPSAWDRLDGVGAATAEPLAPTGPAAVATDDQRPAVTPGDQAATAAPDDRTASRAPSSPRGPHAG